MYVVDEDRVCTEVKRRLMRENNESTSLRGGSKKRGLEGGSKVKQTRNNKGLIK